MEEAERPGSGSSVLERAILFRDGLIIMFVALTGTRRGALRVMRIGEHLQRREGSFEVRWSASEMKGGRRGYRLELGHRLSACFDRYLECHRPILLARAKSPSPGEARAVWLSERGTHLSEDGMSRQVGRRTEDAFNIAVNLHAFRQSACTTIAIEIPEHAWIATPLLQHATGDTATQVYNLGSALEASRRVTKAIDADRFGTRRRKHGG